VPPVVVADDGTDVDVVDVDVVDVDVVGSTTKTGDPVLEPQVGSDWLPHEVPDAALPVLEPQVETIAGSQDVPDAAPSMLELPGPR